VNEYGLAMEPRRRLDPVKQLACAVLLVAFEDLGAAGTDKQMDAKRFLFGESTEYREARRHWLSLAGLPLDCMDRFRDDDAQAMKARMKAVTADRRGRAA
jgi:hypothetical protein